MRHANIFGRICLCVCLYVCLCICNTLTFESIDLECLVLVCNSSSEYLDHIRISRSESGHKSKKACLCILFAGGVP